MNRTKRARLRAKGWKVGSADEFLGLSRDEAAFVELKLALSDTLRGRRASSRLTQAELAKRLRSSQSRVAKMERGDPSVSVDLLLRSLLVLGVSSRGIARAIASRPRRALAQAKGLAGRLSGPGDLSTSKARLAGFGRA